MPVPLRLDASRYAYNRTKITGHEYGGVILKRGCQFIYTGDDGGFDTMLGKMHNPHDPTVRAVAGYHSHNPTPLVFRWINDPNQDYSMGDEGWTRANKLTLGLAAPNGQMWTMDEKLLFLDGFGVLWSCWLLGEKSYVFRQSGPRWQS